jgi:hypothetical protein
VRLAVTGDAAAEIAPEIIVKPKDMHIVKGESAVDLQCVANARYVYRYTLIKQGEWVNRVKFEVFVAMKSQFMEFWVVTLCSNVVG